MQGLNLSVLGSVAVAAALLVAQPVSAAKPDDKPCKEQGKGQGHGQCGNPGGGGSDPQEPKSTASVTVSLVASPEAVGAKAEASALGTNVHAELLLPEPPASPF